jgi:lysophospholipase L1-like esterase
VLAVLSLGTVSIGAAVGGAGGAPPSPALTTAGLVEPAGSALTAAAPAAGPPGLQPPADRSSWPPSAAATTSLVDIRSDRTCVPSSTAALDRGEAPPPSAPTRTGTVRAALRQAVDAPRPRPVAVFLGDSYTSGYNGAGLGRAGWPAIVSAALGFRPLNRAVPGTGFINPGWTAQPIRTRIAGAVRAHPRLVILAGGHNDRRFATAATSGAADLVIARLRRAFPDAVLVVIGPIWSNGDPPLSLLRLRDHLRRTSAAVGAIFIDPLGAGWFAGSARRLIGPDDIHPTNAGHRHIAHLVLRAIRADPRFPAPTDRPAAASPATRTTAATTPRRVAAPAASCPF